MSKICSKYADNMQRISRKYADKKLRIFRNMQMVCRKEAVSSYTQACVAYTPFASNSHHITQIMEIAKQFVPTL